MKSRYLYLLINIVAVSLPLLLSFYPKAPFYKKWKYAWPAILGTALLFILLDMLFTAFGVLSVNSNYVLGINLFNLPIEEMLFFICIPYACMFTYFALIHVLKKDYLFPHQELISSLLCVVLLIAGMYQMDKAYTGATFLLTGGFIAFQMLVLKPRYMGRFYMAFAIILIPFLIVYGMLTGLFMDDAIVRYEDNENLGLRIGTIPLENIFFGLLILIANVSAYEYLKTRDGEYYSIY